LHFAVKATVLAVSRPVKKEITSVPEVDFFFFWRANKFSVPRRNPHLTPGGLQMFSLLFPSHRLAVNLAVNLADSWLIPGCYPCCYFLPKNPQIPIKSSSYENAKKRSAVLSAETANAFISGIIATTKVLPKNCGEEGRQQTVMSLTERFSHPGPFCSGTIPLYACRVGTDPGRMAPVSVGGCDAALSKPYKFVRLPFYFVRSGMAPDAVRRTILPHKNLIKSACYPKYSRIGTARAL
jgi:hypothetical protein